MELVFLMWMQPGRNRYSVLEERSRCWRCEDICGYPASFNLVHSISPEIPYLYNKFQRLWEAD